MSVLSDLKTYWQNNSNLTFALSVSNVYLDLVPPNVVLPYVQLTIPESQQTEYNFTASHIEKVTFNLTIYSTSADALETLGATVDSEINTKKLTTNTMSVLRQGEPVRQAQVIDGVYTYHMTMVYEWLFFTTTFS